MNPLLEIQFRIPFDQIAPEHVEPAIDQLLGEAREALEAAARSDDPLNALDYMSERLDYAIGVVRHLESVATTPELRAAYNAVQPKVSAYYSSIPLHEGLWKALQSYSASGKTSRLDATRRRFLTKTIDAFKRHGAELAPEGKKRLQEIDVELSALTTKYSENVLDSTNAYELPVIDEAKLAGLPPAAIAMARASAESKGQAGWRFTLQAPSYMAVMTYLNDRTIREQMYKAYSVRASDGERDNRPIIKKILALRKEKPNLLGFRDFADLVLEDRMAHTGERAQSFLASLGSKTQQRFTEENQELERFAGMKLEPWDIGYYAEKQRRALRLRRRGAAAVLPAGAVVAGMFEISVSFWDSGS